MWFSGLLLAFLSSVYLSWFFFITIYLCRNDGLTIMLVPAALGIAWLVVPILGMWLANQLDGSNWAKLVGLVTLATAIAPFGVVLLIAFGGPAIRADGP